MKLTIDTDARTATLETGQETLRSPLYTREAFGWISKLWLKLGWNQKYTYSFSWLGRPIIQLPEDLIRVQEVIYQVKPDVIIETGVAHGGSLVYYASLCRAMGHGRVIGIDIEIRPQNSRAIEMHELAPLITLIQGDSVAPSVLEKVRVLVGKDERCLVILDSVHTSEHVYRELEAYAGFVAPDSYIIVNDGIMRDLVDVPRGDPTWEWDNPAMAAKTFAVLHRDFVLEQPPRVFNESDLDQNVTHWPGGYLRRL